VWPFRWVLAALAALTNFDEYEVWEILRGDPKAIWWRPAHVAGFQVDTAWGRTRAGRYLIVVTRRTAVPHENLIIGPRDMTPAEIAEYEQWKENRDA
jgi:hypothetical protein